MRVRLPIVGECSIRRRLVGPRLSEVESTVTLSHRYLGIEVRSKRDRAAACRAFGEAVAGLWRFTHDDSVKLTPEGEERRRRLDRFVRPPDPELEAIIDMAENAGAKVKVIE